jgi:hypothetical protein
MGIKATCRRRWHSFSLRALLGLITFIACYFAAWKWTIEVGTRELHGKSPGPFLVRQTWTDFQSTEEKVRVFLWLPGRSRLIFGKSEEAVRAEMREQRRVLFLHLMRLRAAEIESEEFVRRNAFMGLRTREQLTNAEVTARLAEDLRDSEVRLKSLQSGE